MKKYIDSLRHIRPFFENLRWYGKWLFTSRDYDYQWLLEVIQLWLKKADHHNKTCEFGRKNSETHIKECINLIQAIMEDDFCVDETIAHDKKWGKLWTTSKKMKDTFGGDTLYQMNFHRKNVKTEADRKQERKEKNAIYKLEELRKKKAINRFFYLFKRHFQKWWC